MRRSHTLGLFLIIGLAAAVPLSASELADRIQNRDWRGATVAIEAGADVNATQGDGTTPLHWAIYHVEHELTRTLLEAGADPDVVNRYGSSPLAEAVKTANVALVELLLEAGRIPKHRILTDKRR